MGIKNYFTIKLRAERILISCITLLLILFSAGMVWQVGEMRKLNNQFLMQRGQINILERRITELEDFKFTMENKISEMDEKIAELGHYRYY